MKRNNKKGFTIVELVIVIAVIAILSAVLIPTFSGIVKKARISADTQLCKNMNTALDIAKADGAKLDTMDDVLFAINDAGYVIENLNPTTEGFYFAWDSEASRIVFLNNKLSVYYPADATITPAKSWITVSSDAEADKIAAKGFALYLEPATSGEITLDTLVNVDAGVNKDVVLSITSNEEKTVAISGEYSSLTLNVPNADVNQYGVVKTLNATAVKSSTLNINGYVETLNIEKGRVFVKDTGIVKTIEILDETKAEIAATSTGLIIDEASRPAEYTAPDMMNIKNKADLIAFRDAVNAGYTFEGLTVNLKADIDLAGVAWLPIGNVYRKNAGQPGHITGFAGTFNGNNYTIKNLSNQGFSVDGLASGRNNSTTTTKNEVVFGLFGSVKNATILNLKVNANISDIGSKYVADSVAAIVGYAYGDTFNMENCKSSGYIDGSDGIGGLVGRIYAKNAEVKDCANSADLAAKLPSGDGSTGKAGGIVGYYSCTGGNLAMSNVTNTGTLTANAIGQICVISKGNSLNNVKQTQAPSATAAYCLINSLT